MVSLESRVITLEHEVRTLKAEQETVKAQQNSHHAENSLRLSVIEKSLMEIAVYLKVGRWVMHAVWAVVGAVGTGFIIKWLGAKP